MSAAAASTQRRGLRLIVERSKTTGRSSLSLMTLDHRTQLRLSLHERHGQLVAVSTAYIWSEGQEQPVTLVCDMDDVCSLDNILGPLNFKRGCTPAPVQAA